jgi:hypothetical protein
LTRLRRHPDRAETSRLIVLGIVSLERLLKMCSRRQEVALENARQAEHSETNHRLRRPSRVLCFAPEGLGGLPPNGKLAAR